MVQVDPLDRPMNHQGIRESQTEFSSQNAQNISVSHLKKLIEGTLKPIACQKFHAPIRYDYLGGLNEFYELEIEEIFEKFGEEFVM